MKNIFLIIKNNIYSINKDCIQNIFHTFGKIQRILVNENYINKNQILKNKQAQPVHLA